MCEIGAVRKSYSRYPTIPDSGTSGREAGSSDENEQPRPKSQQPLYSLPTESNSQVRRIASRCTSSRARNSNPCLNPSRYLTKARNFSGVPLPGSVSSSVATSPGFSSPVKVTPIPSCPNSIDLPHRSRGASVRKTLAETRISSGYRGKRRCFAGSGRLVLMRALFQDQNADPQGYYNNCYYSKPIPQWLCTSRVTPRTTSGLQRVSG
jgi:hypothetical protein